MPQLRGRVTAEGQVIAAPVIAWVDFVMLPGRPMEWFGKMVMPASHKLQEGAAYEFECADGRVGYIEVAKLNPPIPGRNEATCKFNGYGPLQKRVEAAARTA